MHRLTGSNNAAIRLLFLIGIVAVGILVREVLLLGFFSLVLSVWLSYPLRFLSRWIPRGASLLIILLLLVVAVGSLGAFTFPKIYQQGQSVLNKIPQAVDHLELWISKIKGSEPGAQITQEDQVTQQLGDRLGKWIESVLSAIIPAAKGVIELSAALIFVLVLAAFLAYQPESYREGVRKLVPENREATFDEAYKRVGRGFSHWMVGILIAMTLMGSFTGIALAVIGVGDWFFLAILTFFGTFVPYLGAIVSAIPGLVIGISKSFEQFVYVSIVYLGVHILEGYIVEPIVMKRAVEIRPAVLLFGQAVLGTLFGVLGIIVAAPLIVCAQILVEYLYIERHLDKSEKIKSENSEKL